MKSIVSNGFAANVADEIVTDVVVAMRLEFETNELRRKIKKKNRRTC